MKDLLFPVSLNVDGGPPDEGPPLEYFVAANGAFRVTRMEVVASCVKVKEIPGLEPLEEWAEWRLPPIPGWCLESALGFFRLVYDRERSESCVLLYRNHKTGEWLVECPAQEVGPSHVHYTQEPSPSGFGYVGDVHSHCGFGAFQSDTDTSDMEHRDGLHIVLGHVNRERPSIDVKAAIAGKQFEFDLEEVAEVFDHTAQPTAEHASWLEERVTVAQITIMTRGLDPFEQVRHPSPVAITNGLPAEAAPGENRRLWDRIKSRIKRRMEGHP